jgi:hypothetical protein
MQGLTLKVKSKEGKHNSLQHLLPYGTKRKIKNESKNHKRTFN